MLRRFAAAYRAFKSPLPVKVRRRNPLHMTSVIEFRQDVANAVSRLVGEAGVHGAKLTGVAELPAGCPGELVAELCYRDPVILHAAMYGTDRELKPLLMAALSQLLEQEPWRVLPDPGPTPEHPHKGKSSLTRRRKHALESAKKEESYVHRI